MRELESPVSRYQLAKSPDWQVVLRHFELGQGFAFIVLLVPDDEGAEVCRDCPSTVLFEKRGVKE